MFSKRLASVLLKPVRYVPDTVLDRLLARLANHLLRGQRLGDRLQPLDGKTFHIRVTDIPMTLALTIRWGRLQWMGRDRWDVRISGKLHDFWLLANRREDPDTLFFNRRLSMEGDTDVGLQLKNLLDSLEFDWQAHFTAVLGRPLPPVMLRAADNIRSRLRRD